MVWAKMKIELTSTKQKNSYSILKTAVHSPIRNIWLLWVFPYGTKFWGKEQLKTTHHNFQTFSQLTILSPHHQPPQNYNHTKVSTSCILQKKTNLISGYKHEQMRRTRTCGQWQPAMENGHELGTSLLTFVWRDSKYCLYFVFWVAFI